MPHLIFWLAFVSVSFFCGFLIGGVCGQEAERSQWLDAADYGPSTLQKHAQIRREKRPRLLSRL